jgi:hypothetical protein
MFWYTRVRVRNSFTITTLLIDRSLDNQGCIAHNFFVMCTKPQTGIRVESMRSMLVQLEHIRVMRLLIILLLPSNVYLLISVA